MTEYFVYHYCVLIDYTLQNWLLIFPNFFCAILAQFLLKYGRRMKHMEFIGAFCFCGLITFDA